MSIELTPERRARQGHRRDELIPQARVAARELRLRETHAAIESPRDLLVRPALDVVQPHHRARQWREPREGAVEVDEVGIPALVWRSAGRARFHPRIECQSRAMP